MNENNSKDTISIKGKQRRRFLDLILKIGGLTGLGAIVYPVFRYLIPPDIPEANVSSISAGTIDEFLPNTSKIIRFGRKPVIVIRKKNGDFKALSATCTHLDCNVQYRDDLEQIWCACHNGLYNLEGKNISGPPPKPLSQYSIIVNNDRIVITKGESS